MTEADEPKPETAEEADGPGLQELEGASDSEPEEASDWTRQRRAVFAVPVEVTVSVGKARPLIGDLLKMRRDALLPLDSRVEDPVEIQVGNRVIARGELQELDDGSDRLGVRLTEIVDVADAL
jgi:flagellar motor switch protein FliN/FliY